MQASVVHPLKWGHFPNSRHCSGPLAVVTAPNSAHKDRGSNSSCLLAFITRIARGTFVLGGRHYPCCVLRACAVCWENKNNCRVPGDVIALVSILSRVDSGLVCIGGRASLRSSCEEAPAVGWRRPRPRACSFRSAATLSQCAGFTYRGGHMYIDVHP